MSHPQQSTEITLIHRDQICTLQLSSTTGKAITLDHDIMDQLEKALDEAKRIQPKVLVIRSTSPKFFCVGANINMLKTMDSTTMGPWVKKGHDIFNRIENLPFPVVAHVDGYALGGGCELALAADFIYAGPKAKFGLTEANLGFVPGWGGTRRLAERVGKAHAKAMFFGSQIIDAERATAIGLSESIIEAEELEPILEAICQTSSLSLRLFKKMLQKDADHEQHHSLDQEVLTSLECIKNPETLKRVDHFLNR